MAHVRAQIRDAIATALATVGPTVSKSRGYDVATVPALVVYTFEENATVLSMGSPRTVRRDLSCGIEIVAEGKADTLDDTLDGYAALVEKALADNALGGLLKDIRLTRSEIVVNSDGDLPRGLIRMTYSVTYMVHEDDPETAR